VSAGSRGNQSQSPSFLARGPELRHLQHTLLYQADPVGHVDEEVLRGVWEPEAFFELIFGRLDIFEALPRNAMGKLLNQDIQAWVLELAAEEART